MTSTPADTSPARRLRDALEPVAALSFWSEPSLQAYSSVGLDEFPSAYFWLRSSPLGVVEPDVVTAAFGVWEPGLVRDKLAIGRRACSRDAIMDVTQSGAAAAARDVLGGVDEHELRDVVSALRRGIDAADATARTLFAGNRSWTWPDDLYAGLWRAATAWRELRGDSHLIACAVGGISGLQANILTELEVGYPLGEYTATRNWSAGDIRVGADALRDRGLIDDDTLTEQGRRFRAKLESWTDDAVAPAVTAVGNDLDDVVARAGRWAQLIIDRGWFPDDDKKRAAG